MKKLLVLLVVVLAFNLSSAQKVATYEQVKSKEVKGKLDSYITKNGETFNVGDELTIGIPLSGSLGYGATPNDVVVIEKLLAFNKHVFLYAKGDCKISERIFEDLLKNNEVKSNLMSRSEAIAKLKESKDLLDLGLLSQDEYDSIKTELTVIIMK